MRNMRDMLPRILAVLVPVLCCGDLAVFELEGVKMGDSGPILGVYAEFGGRESVGPARFERARPYLACGRVPSDSLNGAAALVGRGNCTFEDKCRAVQSAGAVACVVVNTGQGAFEMGLGEESQLRLGGGLPSIMVGSSVGDQLVGRRGRVKPLWRPEFDPSLAVLVLIAVATVTGGAYWSSAKERGAGAVGSGGGASAAPRAPEEPPTVLSEGFAWAFIVLASVGLVTIFYFINYLIYVLVVIFAFAGAQGIFMSLVAASRSCCPHVGVSRVLVPGLGRASLRAVCAGGVAGAVALSWVVCRSSPGAWVLQDALGIAFLLTLQKNVRLPNAKVSVILLVLAFLYDVFWVFISPLFFKQSVMVAVATGGDTGEPMPMLLRFPRLLDPLPGDSILGLGDIAIPGLYLSYLLRFDYSQDDHWVFGDCLVPHRRSRPFEKMGFFSVGVVGYLFGLLLCDLALVVMRMGQPALLYIVPCVLVPVWAAARSRGKLKSLWNNDTRTASGAEPLDDNTGEASHLISAPAATLPMDDMGADSVR